MFKGDDIIEESASSSLLAVYILVPVLFLIALIVAGVTIVKKNKGNPFLFSTAYIILCQLLSVNECVLIFYSRM